MEVAWAFARDQKGLPKKALKCSSGKLKADDNIKLCEESIRVHFIHMANLLVSSGSCCKTFMTKKKKFIVALIFLVSDQSQ